MGADGDSMRVQSVRPTGVEVFFEPDELIVSKTDPKGVITYANRVFCRVAGYGEHELIGQPHSIIRHEAMPRCVFQLLWDELSAHREVFAYVVNQAKNGDHYWVLAHVTPSYAEDGTVVGYHSSRRVPSRSAVEAAEGLYRELREVEIAEGDGKAGMAAAATVLTERLKKAEVSYHEFLFSL